MNPCTTLRSASAGFAGFLSQIDAAQWDSPTGCQWPVRELVRHVIAGDAMATALMGGASSSEALEILTGTPLDDDPISQFSSVAGTMFTAFEQDGALEQIIHHPMADMPAGRVLGFRMGEVVLHGWDLAQAIGVDEALDPNAVQAVWDATIPSKDMIATLGIFGDGPSGTAPDEAPLQTRLLDLTGRRPTLGG